MQQSSALLATPRFVLLCNEDRGEYLVVTNCSHEEIPLGTEMTMLYAEKITHVGEIFEREAHGPSEIVSLRIATSVIFRKKVDSVPAGYSAAVTFQGHGFEAVLRLLSTKSKDIQVFLGGIVKVAWLLTTGSRADVSASGGAAPLT